MNGNLLSGKAAATAQDTARLLRTLMRAARAVEDRWEDALGQAELSGAKYLALTALKEGGAPLSLSDLAAKLTCVRSNITQLVDRLEADGLVRRVDDPTDRRGKRAASTPLGRERQSDGARRVPELQEAFDKTLAGQGQGAARRGPLPSTVPGSCPVPLRSTPASSVTAPSVSPPTAKRRCPASRSSPARPTAARTSS